MVIRTLVLKLHRPTAAKRLLLDQAIMRYNRALSYLFEHTQDNMETVLKEMQGGRAHLTRRIMGLLKKELMDKLNVFGVQPFKDALKMDYAMMMVAWLSLRRTQRKARYPQVLDEELFERRFWETIREFDDGMIGRDGLKARVNRLYNGYGISKPLFFGRYAKNRDYCLLYDEEHDRFYAKLYLLNVKAPERRGGIARGSCRLRYVTADRALLEEDNRRERYIVAPLSFGKEQEAVLKEGLQNPGIFKTARLLRKNGAYYLSVNIACECRQKERSETYMGIVRSLKEAVRYAVVDWKGIPVAEGGLPYGEKITTKNGMHAAANELVRVAQEYKSHIVSYRMGNIGDKLTYGAERARLTAGTFNQLMAMVNYKAELKGLKKPVFVSPRGIFTTCPRCGTNTQRNRFPGGRMICVKCGCAGDIEKNGPLNAARRLLKYRGTALLFYAKKTEAGLLIHNDVLRLAYLAEPTQEGIKVFFKFVEEKVREMKRQQDRLCGGTAREVSYRKRFMNIQSARDEISIVDEE